MTPNAVFSRPDRLSEFHGSNDSGSAVTTS